MFAEYFREYGDKLMEDLKSKTHVSGTDVGMGLHKYSSLITQPRFFVLTYFFKSENKISYNLASDYYYFMNSSKDLQPGQNLSLNKFVLIRGFTTSAEDSDIIVTINDSREIYGGINSSDKTLYAVAGFHTGPELVSLADRKITGETIKKELN